MTIPSDGYADGGELYTDEEMELIYQDRIKECATNYELWGEYIDPNAILTEEEFNEMTVDERIILINILYPDYPDYPY